MTATPRPRISVALPVYNGANFLSEALDSLLAQEWTDFEVCVSDNCSTDETPAILADYARRDPRIRVSRSETFLLQADNVNRAMDMCRAEWIKPFCHDDLMYPSCLGRLAETLDRPDIEGVVLVGNGEEHLFANGFRHRAGGAPADRTVGRYDGKLLVRAEFEGGSPVGLPSLTTAMVRKDVWARAGRFDHRFLHFDVFMWKKVLLHGDYLFVPDTLTVNRIHGAQVVIEARRTMRTVQDFRTFSREFLAQEGERLGFGLKARLIIRFRPALYAGSILAMAIARRRPRQALAVAARTPPMWWPLLPLLVARSVFRERRRLRELRPHVPLSLIYPG